MAWRSAVIVALVKAKPLIPWRGDSGSSQSQTVDPLSGELFVIMAAPTSAKVVLPGRRLELPIYQQNSNFSIVFHGVLWITKIANGYQ
jgi:hypothetical protein